MDVKDGIANINVMVIDTSVVNVQIGGTVNLKTEEMSLRIEPEPKNASVASLNSPIDVRGTFSEPRVGIPPKELEKIFELFYSTRKGGTGLGLAIVQRIARAHDAELAVQSTLGVGTSISVSLPAAPGAVEARPAKSIAEAASR